MPYNITRSNGTTVQTIADGSIDTSKYSVGIIGRNTLGYGNPTAETVVRILENFAHDSAPLQPIPGQVWYDTGTGYLRYNSGTNDHENSWTKLVSADDNNHIGTINDPYATIFATEINSEAFLDVPNTVNIFATNLGSSSHPLSRGFISTLGSAATPVSQLYVTEIDNVTAIGSGSVPVNVLYAKDIGSSSSRVERLYVDAIDANTVDASTLGGKTPGHYLNYNNFTNVPDYNARFINVSGDTMTGALYLPASAPTSSTQAVTKSYVDNIVNGFDYKDACKAATTGNISLSGAQTIDGVAVSNGDRVLVKNQTNASQNGIYVASTGSWTRATDADGSPASEVTSGMYTFITAGNDNKASGWILTTANPITVGSTGLTFVQNSSSSAYVGGTGIDVTGNTIKVKDTDVLRISDSLAQTVTGAKTFSNKAHFSAGATFDGNIGGPDVNERVPHVYASSLNGSDGTITSMYVNTLNHTGSSGSIKGTWVFDGDMTLASGSTLEATYADLGERYYADGAYEKGTLLKIGGTAEVTSTCTDMDMDVFGVVSSNPAFVLNSEAGEDETHPIVALAGRVPVKVLGEVKKGQRLVSSDIKGVARAITNEEMLGQPATVHAVFGRALEDKDTAEVGLVMAVVGSK